MLRFLLPLLLSVGLAQAQTRVRPLLTLGDSATDPATPCAEGRWYYNTNADIMKCCLNGAWAACASGGAQAGFLPNEDADVTAGFAYSSNIVPSEVARIKGFDVTMAPDGFPIFIVNAGDAVNTIKAIKCNDATCSTYSTNIVATDLYPSVSNLTYKVGVTPGGRVGVLYNSSTAPNDVKFCRCDSSHACSSVDCSVVASRPVSATADAKVGFVALGSKIGIIFYKNDSPSSGYYKSCSNPDASPPCSSLGTEYTYAVNTLTYSNVINNGAGIPIIIGKGAGDTVTCDNDDCSTATTNAGGQGSHQSFNNVVTGNGRAYWPILFSDGGSTTWRLASCTLPTCSTITSVMSMSYTQFVSTSLPPPNNGLLRTSVTTSLAGFPVVMWYPAGSTTKNFALVQCLDALCVSTSTVYPTSALNNLEMYDQSARTIATDSSGNMWTITGTNYSLDGYPNYITQYQSSNMSVTGVNLGTDSYSFADANIAGTATIGNLTVTGLPPSFGRARFVGDLAVSAYSPSAFTGTQHNYDVGTRSYVRLDGSSTPVITGIKANNADGKALFISNVGSVSIQFNNQDSNSTAGNRIITGTGANVTLAADASMTLLYDATTARWRKLN